MRFSFKDYTLAFWQILTGSRTRDERRMAEERERDLAPYLDTSGPSRVLDLANGLLRPQYILLGANGRRVHGVDLANLPQKGYTHRAYSLARWLYRSHLRPGPVGPQISTLVCADVGALPYADSSFDLVTSIAAFEHFLDVPHAVVELRRVLRPGGLAWIRIHPFTSPSGGHNVNVMEIPLRRLPAGVDAWDHLRKQRLPPYTPLNKWRIGQYRAAFAQHFEILKASCAMREGEQLLTSEIQSELAEYTPDELTCGAWVILVRREW